MIITKAIREKNLLLPVVGALLTALLGLFLWGTPLGESWVNSSYDYLFRFGSRAVTNQVALVMMDNEAYTHFDQNRDATWDRELHARLLNKLADDGSAMVVFDSFFRRLGDPAKDAALAKAMQRQEHIVLMATQDDVTTPELSGTQLTLPTNFLSAARTNWGVAMFHSDLDGIVRQHWPFPAPGQNPSLAWSAAVVAGARLDNRPREQWLRYYGKTGPWTRMSYEFALAQPAGYFRNRIVFIGREPRSVTPESEDDKFQTPYSRWTGESVGGVELNLTEFLNLVNHEWLERLPAWLEVILLIVVGALLCGVFSSLQRWTAVAVAVGIALVVLFGAVMGSYYTNYWFPWLIVAGAQVPCALAWSLLVRKSPRLEPVVVAVPAPVPTPLTPPVPAPVPSATGQLPDTPDYQLIDPPFGHGAYGKVWLAKNAVSQWQALKAVYLANFDEDTHPFDREFNGISHYKPISDKHPGLLRVDFVSMKREGYFYYVMELGDSLVPGWEMAPATYKPRDLASVRAASPGKRLPISECASIGIALTDALEFLHGKGLTHRDIKPQNIIFVNGHPKLADVGLISDIRPPDQERTFVGTPGYMPPAPERPGTPQADIYALGMVLYVLATGRKSAAFPEIATTLAESKDPADFFALNAVILKACEPDCSRRYKSAAEMREDLLKLQQELRPASAPPGA